MSDNYPAGTWDGDPYAPWNQPEPWEGKTCEDCSLQANLGARTICLYEPMRANIAEISEVEPDDPACEAFEE